ncbi:hypothetical protein POSPLADRAFT_1128204, partial [Postia placenta MAD-698-R-SB12]
NATTDYQKIQNDIPAAVETRQRPGAHLSEDKLGKKGFAQLTKENTAYKFIWSVLVQQDQAEAKSNMETRLDLIRSKIKRIEARLKDLDEQSEKKAEVSGTATFSPV